MTPDLQEEGAVGSPCHLSACSGFGWLLVTAGLLACTPVPSRRECLINLLASSLFVFLLGKKMDKLNSILECYRKWMGGPLTLPRQARLRPPPPTPPQNKQTNPDTCLCQIIRHGSWTPCVKAVSK